MYEEFVQKFSSNPQAVAYGNWQLAQAYQAAGDLQKSLEYGDKALARSPRNLDILVSQAGSAQQAKNNVKLMDYAAKGGEVCHSHRQADQAGRNERRGLRRKVTDEKAPRRTVAISSRPPDLTRSPPKPIPRTAWPRSRSSRRLIPSQIQRPGVQLCHVHPGPGS